MKLKNIFAVALAVLALTSCDHDTAEDYPAFLGKVNTAQGVSVSLPATFTAQENEAPFQVPVEVSGKTNGKVVVTVQTKEKTNLPEDFEPAKEKEHYIFTTYTVNIAPDETTGYFEVMPVWIKGEINDDRVFEMTIVSVQGATIGNKTCDVTIENVDDAYTAMFGKWSFKSDKCTSSVVNEYTLTISGPDPSDEYYGKELYAYGLRGLNYVFLPLNFEYDKETGERHISIQVASFATDGLINFSGLGSCVVVGFQDPQNGIFGDDIECKYTFDEESKVETIAAVDRDAPWYLGVMPYPALNECYGNWGGWVGITLSRKAE